MALETLKEINEIDGWPVRHLTEGMAMEATENPVILIQHPENKITFKIQQGPIKEVGLNGCQVDTIIDTAKKMLVGLDMNFPCIQNKEAIVALDTAIIRLLERKEERERRGVEGTSKA